MPTSAAQRAGEKPYDGTVNGQDPGTALPCRREFNQNFSAQTWLSALQTALEAARRLPWVDESRTLVLGISEGATMAALLAARNQYVAAGNQLKSASSAVTMPFFPVALARFKAARQPLSRASSGMPRLGTRLATPALMVR